MALLLSQPVVSDGLEPPSVRYSWLPGTGYVFERRFPQDRAYEPLYAARLLQ